MSYISWIVGVISADKHVELYEDTASWPGECASGMMQSPIDLPTDMKAEVHAPINYRNYFNGHFNKVKTFPIVFQYNDINIEL